MTRITLLSIFILVGSLVVSQDIPSETTNTDFGFVLGLGTVSLPKDPRIPISDTNPLETYQRLALQPDISFGKLGVGLDINLHFNIQLGDNQKLDIYEPDWIPEKADKSFMELYLPKIAYVRWGRKGDALYAKLGSFDDGTLGSGFIMGNYSNTRFLPETRIFGAALDIDGSLFNFPYAGIETFAGNLAKFDVFGTRAYIRPLQTFTGIVKNLEVGATLALDTDPLRYADDAFIAAYESAKGKADPAFVFGTDLSLPIITKPVFNLTAFSDLAFENKGRWGSMVGTGGQAFSFINYGAQIRLLGPDFVPTYFDAAYDLFRHLKYVSVAEDPEGDPFLGWFASLGFSILAKTVNFNLSMDGPFILPSDIGGIADYPHLRSSLGLAELAGFSFDALYEKYYLGADESLGASGSFWKDLFSPENSLIGAAIKYRTGPALISLNYNLRYDPSAPNSFVVSSSLMTAISF